jgi:hypothetical protein
VLRIKIALKNPSPSAGFEPWNLESNGKHDNYYTTEDDHRPIVSGCSVIRISEARTATVVELLAIIINAERFAMTFISNFMKIHTSIENC